MTEVSEARRSVALAAAALVPAAAVALSSTEATAAPAAEADLAELRALLAAHDKAFTAHDLPGVLKTFAPGTKASVVGTGPGELWVGPQEIGEAYKHFFEGFDPGKQAFEYEWRSGRVGAQIAWMTTVGKITLTKGSQVNEVGMNFSVVAEKVEGRWCFVSLHFSNLTPCPEPAK